MKNVGPPLSRIITLFWGALIVILCIGIIGAAYTGVPYWVDRSGKLIVTASLTLTFFQFQLESRRERLVDSELETIKKQIAGKGAPIEEQRRTLSKVSERLEHDFELSRRKVFVNALVAAATGEVISAFGGVAFSVASRFLEN